MNQTLHMRKQVYDGYCVGVGIEHPGIIVSAASEDDLVHRFREAIPSYMRALSEFGVESEPANILDHDQAECVMTALHEESRHTPTNVTVVPIECDPKC